MSQQISLSTPTELMNPGQTSDALRVKLRQVGSRISDAQLTAAWHATEKSRVSFTCAAIALGTMLLAKKESLGHGKWIPWCEKFGSTLHGKLATRGQFAEEITSRSLRRYTFLAEHFLSSIEQGEFTGEFADHKPKLEGVTADQVMALDHLPAKARKAVFGRIEQFVAGRSLRTMLLDFRRAENAADQEEAARTTKKGGDKDPAAQRQLEFAEMLRPIGEIDTLFDTKSFVERTDKAFWLSIAEKLTTQAERARAMAKGMQA